MLRPYRDMGTTRQVLLIYSVDEVGTGVDILTAGTL
jgi:hypothetical protein